MGRILYLDASAGIAGDMTLAALIHAGAVLSVVRDAVSSVAGKAIRLSVEAAGTGPVAGLRLRVRAPRARSERPFKEIARAIARARLPGEVADIATRIFERLAEAEGRVHAVPAGRVHFHEVGALDSIADVVGVAAALASLGVERVHASPLPMTRGSVVSRHGRLPVPAPATVDLLRGYRVFGVDAEGEYVTPTGAAICATLAHPGGPMPPMRIEAVGHGFGTREWPDGRPNCVRAFVGPADSPAADAEWELSANIDDMAPDAMSNAVEALLAAGALDAWVTPVVMKKGRPAWVVSAIVPPAARDGVVAAFFEETSTIGLRMHPLERVKLAYRVEPVQTPIGTVRLKRAFRDGRVANVSIESDDLRRVAREAGITLKRAREIVSKAM